MLQGSLFGPVVRAGICRKVSRVSGSVLGRQFHASSQIPTKSSGLMKSPIIETRFLSSILGNMGMKLGLVRVAENVPLPCALNFRSFLHSGEQPPEVEGRENPRSMGYEQFTQESGYGINERPQLEGDVGRAFRSIRIDHLSSRERGNSVNAQPPFENEAGRSPISMDYVRGLLQKSDVNERPPQYQQDFEAGRIPRPMDDGVYQGRGNGRPQQYQQEFATGRISRLMHDGVYQGRFNDLMGVPAYYNQTQLDTNADIVHIKVMRNNSHVTLTDYKGNIKKSVAAGQVVAKGEKPGRYSGEAAAEYMGRVAKQMKIRSVVVKVSGYTFFRRKKDCILAFKDGYTHSRGDVNPVVYIEDTTRKPHNGCRLPKKRRI